MKQIFRISIACAALAAAPALAADYDPPIFIEEAPEYVPVEIGSGWYLRGDISYNAGKPIHGRSLPNVSHQRFGVGAGIGYHFTDNFRADLTVGYLGRDRMRNPPHPDEDNSAWNGLVSGYYDIATIVGITPYVGAGLGLTYSSRKFPDRSTGYNFAYALTAGAAYKVSDNVSLDLGYQFLHTPDAKYRDYAIPADREGAKHHLIKLGLRYDLW